MRLGLVFIFYMRLVLEFKWPHTKWQGTDIIT